MHWTVRLPSGSSLCLRGERSGKHSYNIPCAGSSGYTRATFDLLCTMRTFLLLSFLFALQILPAQNLVPNGSFEEFTECPQFAGYPEYAGWQSAWNSPDYFNACCTTGVVGVPSSSLGYQLAAHGQSYAGVVTMMVGDFSGREVLLSELNQPMAVGELVYISYKISAGANGNSTINSANWFAKGPDVRFFEQLPTDWLSELSPNSAALAAMEVLSDTLGWITVSGSYLPDSAYRYIAICNFFEDSLSSPELFDPEGIPNWAYAFVDDVCVSYSPTYCSVSTKIEDPHNTAFQVLRNPFTDQLTFIRNGPAVEDEAVAVLNALGQLVLEARWPSYSTLIDIPTAHLSEGIYWAVVQSRDGPFSSRKLLHLSY